jgi:hypothetical protein
MKRAHHPVQDDCLFWADTAGMPAPPPAAHAPSCLFEGGKDTSECLVCYLVEVADRVWETGEAEIFHNDAIRADFVIIDDPSDVTGDDAAEIFGRLRRGDGASMFVLGPLIANACPYDDHASRPEESARTREAMFGKSAYPHPLFGGQPPSPFHK